MSGLTCLLCGSTEAAAWGLVRWREEQFGRRFEALPRCRDRVACRERLEALGEAWPVREAGEPELRDNPPFSEPVPGPPVRRADAEDVAWLERP